jgi:hypothetical protein
VKSVLRLWFKDDQLAQDVSLGIADMVGQGVPGFFERRRTQRQFEGVAEDIAARLATLIEAGYQALPENDIEATVHAVADSMDAAAISLPTLVGVDLDPVRLVQHVRAASRETLRQAGLPSDSPQTN